MRETDIGKAARSGGSRWRWRGTEVAFPIVVSNENPGRETANAAFLQAVQEDYAESVLAICRRKLAENPAADHGAILDDALAEAWHAEHGEVTLADCRFLS